MNNTKIENKLDGDFVSVHIQIKTKYYNKLVELKTTKRTWFDFALRPILVKAQETERLEREYRNPSEIH